MRGATVQLMKFAVSSADSHTMAGICTLTSRPRKLAGPGLPGLEREAHLSNWIGALQTPSKHAPVLGSRTSTKATSWNSLYPAQAQAPHNPSGLAFLAFRLLESRGEVPFWLSGSQQL